MKSKEQNWLPCIKTYCNASISKKYNIKDKVFLVTIISLIHCLSGPKYPLFWHGQSTPRVARTFTLFNKFWMSKGFLGGSHIKESPWVLETWVRSLSWEDPMEEGMATHSSTFAWRIPMDRGPWQAAVYGVAELDMTEWLSTVQDVWLQSRLVMYKRRRE